MRAEVRKIGLNTVFLCISKGKKPVSVKSFKIKQNAFCDTFLKFNTQSMCIY